MALSPFSIKINPNVIATEEIVDEVRRIFKQVVTTHDNEYTCKEFAEKNAAAIFRFWRLENYCDVVLIAGEDGVKVPAHRVILSASTDYFSSMFSNNFKEAKLDKIIIKGIAGNELKALVQYAYTGKIIINIDNAQLLLEQASLMQYFDVVKACEDFLIKQLEPANCFALASFGELHNCKLLLKAAKQFQKEHFENVVLNEEYLHLNEEEVHEFLSNHELEAGLEKTVFKAIIKWINYDHENRKCFFSKLLSVMRLHIVDDEFLLNDIIKHVRDNNECLNIILKAKLTSSIKFTIGVDKKIHIYKFKNNSIKSVHNIQLQQTDSVGIRMALVEDTLIVVGLGEDGRKVKSLNVKTGIWNNLPSSNCDRRLCSLTVLNTDLYAISGFNSIKTVERFDTIKNEWCAVAGMNGGQGSHFSGVLNGKLYAVGGRNAQRQRTNRVECYNPQTNTWSVCAPMLQARSFAPVVGADNHLFVFGGSYNGCLKCIEKYNPDTNKWTKISELKNEYSSLDACLVDNKIFLGGYVKSDKSFMMEQFDLNTNKCQLISKLPIKEDYTPNYIFISKVANMK